MKKVSAFSVFSGRGKKGRGGSYENEAAGTEDESDSRKSSLRRAASTPTVNESSTKTKKLLRVLKGGSLRSSLKGSAKTRPSLLQDNDSPYVAGNSTKTSCELTGIKKNGITVNDARKLVDGKRSVATEKKESGRGKKKPSPVKTAASSDKKKSNCKPQLPVPKISPLCSKKPSNKDLGLPPKGIKQKSSPKHLSKRRLSSPEATPTKRQRAEESLSQDGGELPEISGIGNLQDTEEAESSDGAPVHCEPRLPHMFDSSIQAKKTFECMIHPLTIDKFFKELWERKPLLVKRHIPHYNEGWFSTAELDKILRQENIQFSVNLDVTTYQNGKRETLNPVGRAYAPVVWDFYQNGCSVRLLNPQSYSRNVWKLLSVMQEYFGCGMGANIYLTPPGTQGFAPHYDDIEAFILQLEGKKHWRLYSPRSPEETLPKFSSEDFALSENIGEPILDTILEAGDLLYFPRGTIHQGRTEDVHSLHITVSCYQKNTYGDFLEKLIPRALQIAFEENLDFRKGLPKDFLNYMGVANSEKDCMERQTFMKKIEQLMMSLFRFAPVDAAADQMGKRFIHDSLPPLLSEAERSCSIHGTGERWDEQQKQVKGTVEIEPDTSVKIIRKGVIRLITEEDQVRIYHSLENTRVYHEVEPQYIEIPAETAPAVEYLIHEYPDYVTVDSLPLDSLQDRIDIARDLYERGLLLTEKPLEPLYEESDCEEDDDARS